LKSRRNDIKILDATSVKTIATMHSCVTVVTLCVSRTTS